MSEMVESMVERVARAIAETRAGKEAAAVSEFNAGNLWCEAKREARAAIAAMREPTKAMQEAADWDAAMSHYEHGGIGYRAMIDAALS